MGHESVDPRMGAAANGYTAKQEHCLITLPLLLDSDDHLDAAEAAAFHAIDLIPEEGHQFLVCESRRALGSIYRSKGDIEKAIHYELTELFRNENRSDDAHTHIERARVHTVSSAYNLGRAMELKARVWYHQSRHEEARCEALSGRCLRKS